jgi:hypothetical protein
MERFKALAISSAGVHFCLLVFAAQAIDKEMEPSVQSILLEMQNQWKKQVQVDIDDG